MVITWQGPNSSEGPLQLGLVQKIMVFGGNLSAPILARALLAKLSHFQGQPFAQLPSRSAGHRGRATHSESGRGGLWALRLCSR